MVLLLVILMGQGVSAQKEQILEYNTRIEVQTDRSIIVTENIKVQVSGEEIKRGITRFLPGTRDLNGRRVNVFYDILEVERDGRDENYRTEDVNGGSMLYLGEKDVLLEPDVYLYTIRYHVPNQIGFYETYDEIYWNAVGTENVFPVQSAFCEVIFPDGADIIQDHAYVGYMGSTDQSYESNRNGETISYTVTRPLRAGEGLSVAVGIDKGIIDPPGFLHRVGTALMVILATILMLPYYLYTWWKYGQDPPTPASYPSWNPPDGLSAASINYVQRGRYESKGFTASVIDLAIKGQLRIEEEEQKGFFTKKKNYRLIRTHAATKQDLPREERELMNRLFQSSDEVLIDGKYDKTMEKAFLMHKGSLQAQHRSFIRKGHNGRLLVIPILTTVAVIVIGIILQIRNAYSDPFSMTALIAFVPISIGLLVLYGYLIKKPSPEKLDLRARIKGFLMYLEMAEKDRLRLLNPPDMTPEHFEAVLPYAFALGVEHQWSEKFRDILEKAQYRPQWHNSPTPIYFANNFGKNFEQSVSGAATKPSSSGGSGGGGFSGGGGGGGGVGGW